MNSQIAYEKDLVDYSKIWYKKTFVQNPEIKVQTSWFKIYICASVKCRNILEIYEGLKV